MCFPALPMAEASPLGGPDGAPWPHDSPNDDAGRPFSYNIPTYIVPRSSLKFPLNSPSKPANTKPTP